LTAFGYDPAGRIKEVYYPFNHKKKVEDLEERISYGLLPEYQEPLKFKLDFQPNINSLDFSNLDAQLRELESSLNEVSSDPSNGSNPPTPKEVKVKPG
jgi:cell division protein FtsX